MNLPNVSWKLLAVGGFVGATILAGTLAGQSPQSAPVPAYATVATATPSADLRVVGYWSPDGDVVGVVDLNGAVIVASWGEWVQVETDGGGVVWVRLADVPRSAVLRGGE